MENLAVKDVNFNGDMLKAVQDEKGKIWVGVNWVCKGIGLTDGQKSLQYRKLQKDEVLSKGVSNLTFLTNGGNQEMVCLDLEYLPLWLAKISITPKMRKETPYVADKLVEYQLKAKDVLSAAFFKSENTTLTQPMQTIQLALPNMAAMEEKISNLEMKTDLILSNLDAVLKEIYRANNTLTAAAVPEKVRTETVSYGDWKKNVDEAVNKCVAINNYFTNTTHVLIWIYNYMTNTYGIVWEQEIKEYKEKNGYSRATKMDVVYSKGMLRSIFESILADLPGKEIKKRQSMSVKDSLEEIIKPLAVRRNDHSKHYCATFRMVYKQMGVNWKEYPSNKRKAIIIMEDSKLRRNFEASVNQLMKEGIYG